MEHLETEGYPTEADPGFKEANTNDLAHIIVHPILSDFMRKTGRNIQLRREQEILYWRGDEAMFTLGEGYERQQ